MSAGAVSAGRGVATALGHALGWLVFANLVGVMLAVWLCFPGLQMPVWTYGRWVPVHLNVQLFGWTSLPLVGWLLRVYEVDRSRVGSWGVAVVWGWTAALLAGVLHWLGGVTSGKVFLDWRGGALWGLVAAMVGLWVVLYLACRERAGEWAAGRRRMAWLGVGVLAVVPWAMVWSSSPGVYPPVDVTTGGPTGASLLGSTLVVVTLMLLLPRAGVAVGVGRAGGWTWSYLGNCWMVFVAAEWIGGTHHEFHQIGAMALLFPWVVLIPRDWSGFDWPAGTRVWRWAMFGWWALLVFSGVLMFLPGLLDRIKFTQGLVAHSHVAMAGFTTSFCALVVVALGERPLAGGRVPVVAWHAAALGMVLILAVSGWLEGGGYAWMLGNPWWRTAGLHGRLACGLVMLVVSAVWFFKRSRDE